MEVLCQGTSKRDTKKLGELLGRASLGSSQSRTAYSGARAQGGKGTEERVGVSSMGKGRARSEHQERGGAVGSARKDSLGRCSGKGKARDALVNLKT